MRRCTTAWSISCALACPPAANGAGPETSEPGPTTAEAGEGMPAPTGTEWTGIYGSGFYGLSFVVGDDGRIRDLAIADSVIPPCGDDSAIELVSNATAAVLLWSLRDQVYQ